MQPALVCNWPQSIPFPMDITFGGKMSGQLSSLKYARYALSINEINALMTHGPSKNVSISTIETPPYNGDTWWVDQHK
jgi:hypothetical protein